MGELTSQQLQLLSASILPLLFGITVHEVAHGWVAKHLGDPTAQRLGRLTLNPIKHIDPIGTIVVPFALLLLTGRPIGWAKPVPITWENLRHPKRDMAIVAFAGPLANLLMVFGWALIAKMAMVLSAEWPWVAVPLKAMGDVGIFINAVLMVLNLLPIPPLDGGRIAVGLLPGPLAWQLSRVEPFGFFILIALLYLQILDVVLITPVLYIVGAVYRLMGLQ